MSEIKQGTGVVGITFFNGNFVMGPVNEEDFGKRERVVENAMTGVTYDVEMTTIAQGMRALWSGKVELEDGELPEVFVPNAFGREFTEETRSLQKPDIILHPDQLRGKPEMVGKVEQIRRDDGHVLFYVFALPLVEFTWQQMNDLSGRLPQGEELLEIPLEKLQDFLNNDWQNIRPTSLIAAQSLLGQKILLPTALQAQNILSQNV